MLVAAAGFALLLGGAAIGKLRDRDAFVAVVEDYRLVPSALLRPFGYAVPLLEAAVALAWLAAPWRTGAMWIAATCTAALMVVYGVAITANLLRGRTWIDCGCGAGEQLSWGLVARNAVLAALALAPLPISLIGPISHTASPGWPDAALALPMLAVCVVLYFAIGTLLDNDATASRSPRDFATRNLPPRM